jgi:hypothetical protein
MTAWGGTPRASRVETNVWRRSCNRTVSNPAAFRTAYQLRFRFRGFTGLPVAVVNTRDRVTGPPPSTHSPRPNTCWTRRPPTTNPPGCASGTRRTWRATRHGWRCSAATSRPPRRQLVRPSPAPTSRRTPGITPSTALVSVPCWPGRASTRSPSRSPRGGREGGRVRVQAYSGRPGQYDGEAARDHLDVVRELYAEVYAEPPYREGPEDVAGFAADWPRRVGQPGVRWSSATPTPSRPDSRPDTSWSAVRAAVEDSAAPSMGLSSTDAARSGPPCSYAPRRNRPDASTKTWDTALPVGSGPGGRTRLRRPAARVHPPAMRASRLSSSATDR